MSSDKIPKSSKLFEFMTALEDDQWHSISAIAKKIHVDLDKFKKACDLLAEYGLIKKEGEKIKVCSLLAVCKQTS